MRSARRVRRHPDFEADYRSQIDWLARNGEREWIVTLASDLHRVVRLLSRFPAAGHLVERRGAVELRKLLFPKGPYVAWYVRDTSDLASPLCRGGLSPARPPRPVPDPARWLPRGPT